MLRKKIPSAFFWPLSSFSLNQIQTSVIRSRESSIGTLSVTSSLCCQSQIWSLTSTLNETWTEIVCCQRNRRGTRTATWSVTSRRSEISTSKPTAIASGTRSETSIWRPTSTWTWTWSTRPETLTLSAISRTTWTETWTWISPSRHPWCPGSAPPPLPPRSSPPPLRWEARGTFRDISASCAPASSEVDVSRRGASSRASALPSNDAYSVAP